jgi:hypothetical protein
MPLKKDGRFNGTNTDGSQSDRFCKNCFGDGKFREPDMTVEQMQERVKEVMKKMRIPGFLAGFFTKGIPKLERWKKV